MSRIFITGGTGFIGKQLLSELSDGEFELFVLVRSKSNAVNVLQEICLQHIHLVEGDLSKENLGLNLADKEMVMQSDIIVHAGGPMNIEVAEKEAISSFLHGARHIGSLASEIHQTKGLKQFIHIVGYMSPFDDENSQISIDVFKEGDEYLKIKNPYEKTKFLADLYIRQQAEKYRYPLSVVNPPVVVGSSESGSTEQLGGLGLLVSSVRKGLMPVVPGGAKYRLPIITKDHLASFIKVLIKEEAVSTQTYTLVPDKHADPDMRELLSIMSASLNVAKPSVSVPIGLLKILMKTGIGKLAGIPADSLSFITKKDFSNHSSKRIMEGNWLEDGRIREHLPLVVADLDYRLTHTNNNPNNNYKRSRIRDMAVYQLEGEGKPVILIHGLLSDGEDLFPLGQHIHELTNQPVWIIDLPGLGRSPFKENHSLLDIYLNAFRFVLKKALNGAHLVGHSFGAFLLLEAMKRNYIRKQDTITVLQPPIAKSNWFNPNFILLTKLSLKFANLKQLESFFIKQGLFTDKKEIPQRYLLKVKQSTSSPRILNTTAQLNLLVLNALNKKDFKPNQQLHIIWGNKDRAYSPPLSLGEIEEVPYGHHFPISHPRETAQIVYSRWENAGIMNISKEQLI